MVPSLRIPVVFQSTLAEVCVCSMCMLGTFRQHQKRASDLLELELLIGIGQMGNLDHLVKNREAEKLMERLSPKLALAGQQKTGLLMQANAEKGRIHSSPHFFIQCPSPGPSPIIEVALGLLTEVNPEAPVLQGIDLCGGKDREFLEPQANIRETLCKSKTIASMFFLEDAKIQTGRDLNSGSRGRSLKSPPPTHNPDSLVPSETQHMDISPPDVGKLIGTTVTGT
ncbi:hypothetical protein STEG23_022100 [Scotinomys teguina]